MKNTQSSNFELLKGKASFTNEPLWYRLTVLIIVAVFCLLLVYFIGKWSIPFLVKNFVQEIPAKFSNLFKGRSP